MSRRAAALKSSLLLALAAGLAGTGVWFRTLREQVIWTGPQGSGTYEQPSAVFSTAGIVLMTLAVVLLVGAAMCVRSPRHSL